MILDDFKLRSLVMQVSYSPAFELWDAAGNIARELSGIWGGLRLNEGTPQQQTLAGKDIVISTGFESGIANVLRDLALSSSVTTLLSRTFDVWRDQLSLARLTRISARSLYAKEFPSLAEANDYVLRLGLVRWPESKVFNLEPRSERSGPDISLRFQDDQTFSVVRVKAENVRFKAELDKDFVEEDISVERSRVVIDFDRGNTGDINAEKLHIDEWFNGYKHVLRRDLPKIIGG